MAQEPRKRGLHDKRMAGRGGLLNFSESVLPQSVHIRRRTFFGEPRALAYLAFTEAGERFSYYGMTAILVLYMSQSLFLPGHVENVVGFGALRSGLESVLGPLSARTRATRIPGLAWNRVSVLLADTAGARRAAPPRIRATMMGIAFLTMFVANVAIGWLGGLFERMTATQFWAMHAAIAALGGILTLAFQRRLSGIIGTEVARHS